MPLFNKLKEAVLSRAVEACAAAIAVLVGWIAKEVAPVLLPSIEAVATKKLLLSLFGFSLLLNLTLLAVVWLLSKKPRLRLKYGIYWDKDKNPYCPSCKNPVSKYGEYQTIGEGYFCKTCSKLFPLADAAGNGMSPKVVLNEL